MRKNSLMLILVATVFVGCSFKPDMPRKDTRYESLANEVIIKDRWWHEFNDAYLNSLIENVLQNNSDLELMLNNVEIARASLGLSRLEYLPTIGYKFDGTRRNNYPMPVNSNSQALYSANFMLNYELDLWGKVKNTANANEAKFKASRYDYETARLSLITNAINTYFQLKSLKEQEKILQDTINSYSSSLGYRQRQFDAGIISPVVIHQTRSQIESANSQLLQVKEQISKVNSALSAMSNRDFNQILYSDISVKNGAIFIPQVPKGIPSNILLKRADIASALEKLKAANFMVGARKASYFPSLSLTGALGYGSTELSNLFAQNAGTWNVVGSLAGPLFDFGRTQKGVELANLEQNAYFISYDKALKDSFSEVRYALDSREFAIKQEQNMKNLVASQGKVYDMARKRFDEGYSDFLELLDAQRGFLNAKLNLSKAHLQNAVSVVNVYKAFGGSFNVGSENLEFLESNTTKPVNMSLSPFSK